MIMKIQGVVLWVVMPCSDVAVHQLLEDYAASIFRVNLNFRTE